MRGSVESENSLEHWLQTTLFPIHGIFKCDTPTSQPEIYSFTNKTWKGRVESCTNDFWNRHTFITCRICPMSTCTLQTSGFLSLPNWLKVIFLIFLIFLSEKNLKTIKWQRTKKLEISGNNNYVFLTADCGELLCSPANALDEPYVVKSKIKRIRITTVRN